MNTIQPQPETLGFQAEVKQLLHLVTHALYSNKEIFLRELISNASDALDRLRFETLSDAALYENDSDLKIWIDFDAEQGTITVRDNGIGMSREEIIANLGTIAKSGTKDFLRALSGDRAKDAHLIGQFGVGFYSSFVVSDRVMVKSRRAGMRSDQGVLWESSGEGEYKVANIEKPARGTEITLFLKRDEDEFLDYWRLSGIITKYSDHILFPIVMRKPPADEKDKVSDYEMVNRATALWTMPKKDIKEDDYKELYKHICHDFEDPLLYSHNFVEGKLEYISLLYIPAHASFDIWQREHKQGLKLYVQRVFIMDNADLLLPNYLRFVRGIVDSKDLPLNVSRELLQSNRIIEGIKQGITKRVLDMLEKLSQEDAEKYGKFWQAMGVIIKEGPAEDIANKERIAKLLRFASTHTDQEKQDVSLDDYIKRMAAGQEKIYYIIADNFLAAQNSPHLEIFRKKGIEVLLLSDRIDEWLAAHLVEYQGKSLQSIAKGDLDIGKQEDEPAKERHEKAKTEFADILKKMQTILADKVKEVRISDRLIGSPACLVAGDTDLSMHMQRIIRAAGQAFPNAKPIMEINPEHPIIKRLREEADEERFADWTEILFGESLLAEGGQLENPADFVKRMNRMLEE